MSLWKRVIETVDAHAEHGDLGEAILQAAFLFEKARVTPERQAALGLSTSQGWTPEVAAEIVDLDARDRLVESLKHLATRRPADPSVGSIYWALGKVADPSLLGFFVEGLREQLNHDPGAVFQILVALDNLGESVFAGRRARSITDVVENRALAEAYLARKGRAVEQ